MQFPWAIDPHAMARGQAASIDVQAYKTAVTCLEITNTILNEQGPELVCAVSTGHPHPIVPPDFRRSFRHCPQSFTSRSQSHVKLASDKCLARDVKAGQ